MPCMQVGLSLMGTEVTIELRDVFAFAACPVTCPAGNPKADTSLNPRIGDLASGNGARSSTSAAEDTKAAGAAASAAVVRLEAQLSAIRDQEARSRLEHVAELERMQKLKFTLKGEIKRQMKRV